MGTLQYFQFPSNLGKLAESNKFHIHLYLSLPAIYYFPSLFPSGYFLWTLSSFFHINTITFMQTIFMEAFLWCAPEFLLLNKLHFFSLRPKPPWSNWIVCCSPRVRWHQIRSLVSPCYYLPLHQHHQQHHHHHHQNDNIELKSVPMQLLLLEIFL